MEIIKKCTMRPIKFICFKCYCVFKEDYVKCAKNVTHRYTGPRFAQYTGDCIEYRDTTVTYTAICPECNHACTTYEDTYRKQCEEEREAEERARKERDENERLVAYHLARTKERLAEKEAADERIMREWEYFVMRLVEQERKNSDKVRIWKAFLDDLALAEHDNGVDFSADPLADLEVGEETLEILQFKLDLIGVDWAFAIAHRDLAEPPSLDHTLYDPFLGEPAAA